MVIGKKFWPIDATVDYSPGANPGTTFHGKVDDTVIVTGIDPAVVTALDALITAGDTLGISGNWIQPACDIVGAGAGGGLAADEIELSVAPSVTAGMGAVVSKLVAWDRAVPSISGGDGPIQAVLCLDSSHGAFEFKDGNGQTITIPASTLVKGAVYYFQIGDVSTVTSGDFIGYSGY
jgi:hypothetical protein